MITIQINQIWLLFSTGAGLAHEHSFDVRMNVFTWLPDDLNLTSNTQSHAFFTNTFIGKWKLSHNGKIHKTLECLSFTICFTWVAGEIIIYYASPMIFKNRNWGPSLILLWIFSYPSRVKILHTGWNIRMYSPTSDTEVLEFHKLEKANICLLLSDHDWPQLVGFFGSKEICLTALLGLPNCPGIYSMFDNENYSFTSAGTVFLSHFWTTPDYQFKQLYMKWLWCFTTMTKIKTIHLGWMEII